MASQWNIIKISRALSFAATGIYSLRNIIFAPTAKSGYTQWKSFEFLFVPFALSSYSENNSVQGGCVLEA